MSGVKYFLVTDFEAMTLMGANGLFTKQRVDPESLPEGFYKYTIRDERMSRFSSASRGSFANRVGDFICQRELDLLGDNEIETEEEYKFTGKSVDLDGFFGEDIRLKIAQELESFVYDYDTYSYQDIVPVGCSREDVVKSVRDGLDDKGYVADCIQYYENIQKADKEEQFLDGDVRQNIRRYISVLQKINEGNRDQLDRLIKIAEDAKLKPAGNSDGKTPDGRQ